MPSEYTRFSDGPWVCLPSQQFGNCSQIANVFVLPDLQVVTVTLVARLSSEPAQPK